MLERVEVWINYAWISGSLISETENSYIVCLDTSNENIACSKEQVRRWMRGE